MQLEMLKSLSEYSSERAKKEFDLGDTLDVKTGLILAALTFLAIQSGEFIKQGGLPQGQAAAQTLSILAMIVGGGLCAWELWPRDYDREPQPIKYMAWVEDTEAYRTKHPDCEPITSERLLLARLHSAAACATLNLEINTRKSTIMFWAFACTLVAFAANVATLAMRLF